MEETFMKHAKAQRGAGGSRECFTGILSKYDSYQRWVRTPYERSKYYYAEYGRHGVTAH